MTAHQLYFEEVEPGAAIALLVKRPTNVQLFRYSAATWNAHRIHYDKEYARVEGYDDILVQSHLHGCFLVQMVMDWAGPRARLVRFSWQNRRMALPGDQLTCTGLVTGKYQADGICYVECRLEERNQRGETCAPGTAVIALPSVAARDGK
jgi:hydroxyacyl-ACP dehydratase HTD2-like protein with hotdog domain